MFARPGPLLHAATFLLLGSQALHHLRFVLAPDHDAGATLSDHGYGSAHLVATGPAIGVLVALALAFLVVRAAGAPRGTRAHAVRLRRVWPSAVVAVLSIYVSQELLEGALGHGHEGGAIALLDGGGWVAGPIAVVLGGLVALAVRVLRAADDLMVAPAIRFVLVVIDPASIVLRAAVRSPARSAFLPATASRAPPVVA